MRLLYLFFVSVIITSCFGKIDPGGNSPENQKVIGFKPIYGEVVSSKKIIYSDTAQPVVSPGNIYVKGNLIYQAEIGKGIHVIDNTVSTLAHRVGFITVNGSSQISIKGNFLYTNSYDDLVVVDMSDINNITEVSRVKGAFPEGRSNYFLIEPTESGYFECPRYDSVVIGWKKDSVWASCYKN